MFALNEACNNIHKIMVFKNTVAGLYDRRETFCVLVAFNRVSYYFLCAVYVKYVYWNNGVFGKDIGDIWWTVVKGKAKG